MTGTPAFVLNGRLDILAANDLGLALYAPIYADPVRPANNARFVFLDPHATEFFRDWDKVANDTVAMLRAEVGRDPYDRELLDLIGELSTRSDEFRRPLGRPQRPNPHQRRQAPPPPPRRGPRPAVRVLPAARRARPEPPRLHRRARVPHTGRPEPAGQLGVHHRRPRPRPHPRRPAHRCTQGPNPPHMTTARTPNRGFELSPMS